MNTDAVARDTSDRRKEIIPMILKRVILLQILLIILCMASCKATPDEPIVISKGDGRLEKIINGAPAAKLTAPYDAPASWTESISGEVGSNLEIRIDAKVSVPLALEYPVFRVEDSELSQEKANKFISCFVGEEKLFDYGLRTETDAHLEKIRNICDHQLNDSDSLLNTQFDDAGVPDGEYENAFNEIIHKREYANKLLVSPKNGVETEPNFDISENPDSPKYLYTYELDKRIGIKESISGRLVSYNPNDENNRALMYTFSYVEKPIDLTIKEDSAAVVAEKELRRIGFDDYNLVNTGFVGIWHDDLSDVTLDRSNRRSDYNQPQCYWFTYTPKIYEDINLLYYSNNDPNYNSNNVAYADNYAPPSQYQPAIHIAVADDGLRYVILHSDMNIKETVNSNVPLLTFSEVQDIFRRYIKVSPNLSYAMERNGTFGDEFELPQTTIMIKDVCLGYMKIHERYEDTELLVPVWMFYGEQHDRYSSLEVSPWRLYENNERIMDTPAGFTFLIINAITGSIIDPMLCY